MKLLRHLDDYRFMFNWHGELYMFNQNKNLNYYSKKFGLEFVTFYVDVRYQQEH